jgi:YegS/Rv2252/BmrU family lipid kinase
MSRKRRFKFIVNPEAGRGKSKHIDSSIDALVRSRSVEYNIQKSERPFDATRIAEESSGEFDVVVAVGGDGTANEVANGLIGSAATMGVIPSGSGNDFAKLLGMDNELETSVDQILTGRTETIDSGTIHVVDNANRKTTRKFVNSVGVGFDAVVAYESQRIRNLKGVPLYLLSVFKSLKNYRPHRFEMSFDGKKEEAENYYLVCVGNGNREGGGFYVTPGAHPADGTFDICTVRHVSIRQALKILPTVLKGAHGKFSEVRFLKGRKIKIGCENPFVVHCDGEILGVENSQVEMEMNQGSLDVIVSDRGLQVAS